MLTVRSESVIEYIISKCVICVKICVSFIPMSATPGVAEHHSRDLHNLQPTSSQAPVLAHSHLITNLSV